MSPPSIPRRQFLATATVTSAAALMAPGQARAAVNPDAASEEFEYEVRRSLPEWLDVLTPEEFSVMRLNQTEQPKSSPLWEETAEGTYCCRGCDLTLYDSEWKEVLDIGWVFFRHCRPNAVLTSIDGGPNPDRDTEEAADAAASMGADGDGPAFVEAHCRRCGSHLGHIVSIRGRPMHCINGASLAFNPA